MFCDNSQPFADNTTRFMLTRYKRLNQVLPCSGSLPPEWADLPLLKDLSISSNELTGSCSTQPHFYCKVKLLKALASILMRVILCQNQLYLCELCALLIRYVLTGTLPDDWARLPSLSSLDASSNKLGGTLPTSWVAMKSLRQLYLHSNKLTGGNLSLRL